jgi:hypothetical protein
VNQPLTLLVGIGVTFSAATANTLSFDDLAGAGGRIPNGYGGLQWSSTFWYGNGSSIGGGFIPGTTSGSKAAFNQRGNPASISLGTGFDFESAEFTGAWRDGLQVSISGLRGNAVIYSTVFTVSATQPTLETFDWNNVTEVDFSASGGRQHAGYTQGAGVVFVMDDLNIKISDGGGAWVLMILGTGGIVAAKRRAG